MSALVGLFVAAALVVMMVAVIDHALRAQTPSVIQHADEAIEIVSDPAEDSGDLWTPIDDAQALRAYREAYGL